MLTLTVHRAADQIGGNCIELELDGRRLLLDAGSPLDAGDTPPEQQVPSTLDLGAAMEGVVVSHPHLDHYGLLRGLPSHWPVWTGGASAALMRLTTRLAGADLAQTIHTFTSFEAFEVGPFTITPLLTDHSAFDAHMLLIEGSGHRVLYSGDFRRTGRKSSLVDRLLREPPPDVDVLLLEGTTLGRAESFPTERDLEEQFVECFEDVRGRVFVSWSAQNVDRTVTIYRAARRAGRELYLDVYSLDVLEQLVAFRSSLPRLGVPGLRGVITKSMARLYRDPRRLRRPEFVDRIAETGRCVRAARLADSERAVVMLRPSLFQDYVAKGAGPTREDAWVFSQWGGYRELGGYPEVGAAFEAVGAERRHIHTSGHASRGDLLAVAHAVGAKALVPIHSFDWDDHLHDFPRVHRLRDGEPMVLS